MPFVKPYQEKIRQDKETAGGQSSDKASGIRTYPYQRAQQTAAYTEGPTAKIIKRYRETRELPYGMRIYTAKEVAEGLPQQENYQLIPRDWGRALTKQYFNPNKSYFAEDPKRLAKYYYLGATQPEGWEAPDWFDQNKYAQAFEYMQAMQGDDWKQWKPFDPDDPSSVYLTTLPEPPREFRLPSEIKSNEDVLEFVKSLEPQDNGLVSVEQVEETEYDKLIQYMYGDKDQQELSRAATPGVYDESELWQKHLLTIFSHQPIEGRPEWSRLAGTALPTGMAIMGGWKAASTLASIGAAIGAAAGTPVAGPIGTIAGAIGGLGLGLVAFRSAYYGLEVPWANTIMRVLDISDEVSEKIYGMSIQLTDNDTQEVLENLGPAWKAGRIAYETEAGDVGNTFMNLMSRSYYWAQEAVNELGGDVEWSTGMTADWNAGEIWALESAVWEPVMIQDGFIRGAALDEARSRIAAGEDKEDVYADMMFRYGFTGNLSDFLMQLAMPGFMDAVPWLTNKAVGKYADVTSNPYLKFAVDATSGYLGVDMLPFVIQGPFERISRALNLKYKGKPLLGTKPIFDTMGVYKNVIRKGDLPLTYWPKTDDITSVKTLFEENPLMFDDVGEHYNNLITKYATKSDTSDVFVLDMDGVNADLRLFFEENLTKAGLDLDDVEIRKIIDTSLDQVHNEVLNSMLNNPGETEADMIRNITLAVTDYVNDAYGTIQINQTEEGVRYYPKLSDWDRKFGGLTDEGRYRELEPRTRKNAFDALTSLTTESQAAIFLDNLTTNMGAILQGFENDPDGMFKLLRMAGEVDPILAGKVATAMLESPASKTVVPAIRAFIESGIPDQLEANIKITEPLRAELYLLAREFEKTPGVMLEDIETSPQKVVQMLKNAEEIGHNPALKPFYDDLNSGALNADLLKDRYSVFVGENYIPFTNTMIQAELMGELIQFSDKWIVDNYYGIKPKPWYFRMSDALKTYMSLAVLGFNPLYAIYNYENNIVTRAAQGVFGFHTPKQIDRYWERFGIKPAMLDVGLGLAKSGEITYRGGQALAAALDNNDWISKVKKAGTQASKLGIFSNISGMIEVSESRQATTIGAMQMMSQLWRPGVGFEKMPIELETTLQGIHPKLPDQIYGLVMQGLNMDEVIDGLYSKAKMDSVVNVMDRAIGDIAKSNPEVARDLFVKTGMLQELTDLMEGAETRQDINNVYDYINSRIQTIYEQNLANDLIAIPEDGFNRIHAEGWSAMMPMWSELLAHWGSRRLLDTVENGIAADQARMLRANKEYDLARNVWNKRASESETQWTRTQNMMLATAKGMIDAIGTDSEHAQTFVNLMGDWIGDWGEGFFAKRKKIYQEYGASELTGDARKVLWDETTNKVNKLYEAQLANERVQLTSMFEALGKVYEETSHRPASEVMAWGDDVIKIWDEGSNNIKTFREGLLKGDFTDAEMRSMWNKFNEETFLPMVNKQREAMMQGAYNLANNQPVDMPDVETATAPMPILTPEIVERNARIARAEQLKTTIIERAQRVGEYAASDKQRRLLASVLSEVYPDSGDRHTVQKYLYDTASVMDARDTMVKASLDLFTAVDETGESVRAIPDNIRSQMKGLLEAAYENQGQGSLWDGKPADNAPAADKAEYNEKKIKTDYEKMAAEVETQAESKLTREQFRTKIREAFKLNTQEQMAIMSLVDAHAELWGAKRGKTADNWYVENMADIETRTTQEIIKGAFEDGRIKLGETELLENGRRVIKAFEGATLETAVHELAHVFRYDLDTAEIETYAKWAGFDKVQEFIELDQQWRAGKLTEGENYKRYITAEEKFADGFTKYLANELALDVAPPAMTNIFQKFGKWLSILLKGVDRESVYPEISPEMKRVYDQLFFMEDNLDALSNNKRILEHAPTGETTTAIGVTTHADYNLQFKIVDLFDLVVSHDLNFVLNKYFPQELQGRFRELGANRAQIYEIAMNFNPNEVLNDTRTVETGPMIIGNDMVVESGNGRTLALLMMVRDFPDKWAEYLDVLSTHLEDKGFTPDALEGIEHPVLVRVRLDDVDRVAFADDTNAPRTKTMTTQEAAYRDAKHWDAQLLADLKVFATTDIESLIKSENNLDVIQSYLSAYPPNERGKYYTALGNEVSQEGMNRLAASIIARVFEGEEGRALVEYMYSSTSGEAKNINATIKNVLGEIAKIEGKIELGQLYPEMSIANMFSEVVLAYLNVKDRYGSYAEFERNWASQPSIYGDAFVDIGLVDPGDAPEIRQIKIDLFQFYGENNKKVSALTQLWKRYADKVLSQPEYMVDQMQLIPMEITPRHTILENVLQDLVDEGKSNEFGDYIRKAQPGLGLEAGEGPTLYQTKVFDEVPPGGLPIPQYEGRLTEEVFTEKVAPILDHMRYLTLDDLTSGKSFALADLPDDVSDNVRTWMHGLREQMASTKLQAMDYGEMMRNRALLNYQERYGIDEWLSMVYPYQFWFTRTMGEMGKRMIDNPQWFRMYRRIREHQKRMEQHGIPSRLEGKFRIPAPWLPDFMGNSLYIDPLSQLFPFTEFSTPFERMAQTGQDVEYATMQIIQGMVKEGMITSDRARQAIENRENDPLWREALAEAQTNMQQSGELTPMNISSMAMSPAMWWNYPYHIMKGTPEKLYPLPGTRLGQAMRTWGQPFKMIGNIMAYPEEQLRRKFNISSFGEWGDYYIDRHISNLVGEGAISVEDGLIAMIEKKGEAYDMAYQLAEKEWALKLPGTQTAMAIQSGKFGAILQTLPTTLFPAGILPEGELIQRGLKVEHAKAWEDYKNGNPNAINEFFEEHPEYEARIALFKTGDERMREFLKSTIWDKYMALDSKNKRLVREQLGDNFTEYFLDKESRDYEAIDIETLAHWSQLLGGYIPDTELTKMIRDLPMYKKESLQVYHPEVVAQVNAFENQREERYPNYKELQDMYYSLPEEPKSIRKGFLSGYPELREYWDWKRDYYENYPLVEQYYDDMKSRYEDEQSLYQTMGAEPQPLDVYGRTSGGTSTSSGTGGFGSYEVPSEVEAFREERNRLFPDYKNLQDTYFSLPEDPKNIRKSFLKDFPELKDYWDWKSDYYDANPIVKKYQEEVKSKFDSGDVANIMDVAESITTTEPALLMQLTFNYYSGRDVEGGAKTMLNYLWIANGRPGNFEDWVREIMYYIMGQ